MNCVKAHTAGESIGGMTSMKSYHAIFAKDIFECACILTIEFSENNLDATIPSTAMKNWMPTACGRTYSMEHTAVYFIN